MSKSTIESRAAERIVDRSAAQPVVVVVDEVVDAAKHAAAHLHEKEQPANK